MSIKILLFGILAEEAGKDTIRAEGLKTIDQLDAYIESKYPSFKNYKYRVSVNQELVSSNEKLSDGDEVALLPPFAGG